MCVMALSTGFQVYCTTGKTTHRSEDFDPRRRFAMVVILVFVGFVIIGQAGATMVSTMVEPFSKFGSLLVFFALFVVVFIAAWILAVRVTERFFTPNPEANRPK
jgi:uncharacterized membrane protein